MSSGSASYSVSATNYGAQPRDSYFNLSAPGVINSNLEITGNLKVDGTTELVGAVTCDAAVNVAGVLTANIGSTTSVALTAVGGGAAVVLTNGTTNAASISVTPSGTVSIIGTPSNPLLNVPAGVVTPLVAGPSSAAVGFPYGLIAAAASSFTGGIDGTYPLLACTGGNAVIIGDIVLIFGIGTQNGSLGVTCALPSGYTATWYAGAGCLNAAAGAPNSNAVFFSTTGSTNTTVQFLSQQPGSSPASFPVCSISFMVIGQLLTRP